MSIDVTQAKMLVALKTLLKFRRSPISRNARLLDPARETKVPLVSSSHPNPPEVLYLSLNTTTKVNETPVPKSRETRPGLGFRVFAVENRWSIFPGILEGRHLASVKVPLVGTRSVLFVVLYLTPLERVDFTAAQIVF